MARKIIEIIIPETKPFDIKEQAYTVDNKC